MAIDRKEIRMTKIKAARSSKSGKFVTRAFADANRDTTQVETIERKTRAKPAQTGD
jgi:tRNA U34 5-carboxymethylaminomethyl modifying GTPase MnmE/TrmE